jgi:aminopeptidase
MNDPRVKQLARILTQYSTKVKPKDKVAIIGQPLATPLIQEVFREVLKAGGYPYLFVRSWPHHIPGLQGLDYIFLNEASEDQLRHQDVIFSKLMQEFDVLIRLMSEYNTHGRNTIDPSRTVMRSQAHSEMGRVFSQRSASGDLRWVISLYPTEAYAQDADMSLQELQDFVYSTTYADTDDPISEWNAIHDQQQKLVDWLAGKKQLTLKGPNVNMSLSIEGRTFINSIRYTYPAIHHGREVEEVELWFEGGKVVKASAEKNQDYLLKVLDTDEGARRLGEVAIGTNKKITKFIGNILFDEKIGSSIHLALGNGFIKAGGKNHSAIHWDMICDMSDGGKVFVDDELFYDSGEFMI